MSRWQSTRRIKRAVGAAAILLALFVAPFVAAPGASASTIPTGSFVSIHQIHTTDANLNCASNEVMIAIHFSRGYALCAQLNFGLHVGSFVTDICCPGQTQVGDSPKMHGCPSDYLIQTVNLMTQNFTCVSLRDSLGNAATLSTFAEDRDENKTTSAIYGFTNPLMHACPSDLAMKGLHVDKNALYCAR